MCAIGHTVGVAAVVRLVSWHLRALVRGKVAQVNLPLVGAVRLALLQGLARARSSKNAGEVVRVADVPPNALVRAVNAVTSKGVSSIFVEAGTLGAGFVVRVDHGLTAPPAKVVRHAGLACGVLRTVV